MNFTRMYFSDEIGGKVKNPHSKPKRDEYSSRDPKRDKSRDRKNSFNRNREHKRNYED